MQHQPLAMVYASVSTTPTGRKCPMHCLYTGSLMLACAWGLAALPKPNGFAPDGVAAGVCAGDAAALAPPPKPKGLLSCCCAGAAAPPPNANPVVGAPLPLPMVANPLPARGNPDEELFAMLPKVALAPRMPEATC
jgi:hypothetical protein